MSSFVPERPTLPPLRSLALPMHGVPSKITLPGIHGLCSSQLVRHLILIMATVPSHRQIDYRIPRTPLRRNLGSTDGRNPSPLPHPCTHPLPRLLHLSPVPSYRRYTIQPTCPIYTRRILQSHMFALS